MRPWYSYCGSMEACGGSGRLASGSADKTLRVWDVNVGECMRSGRAYGTWVVVSPARTPDLITGTWQRGDDDGMVDAPEVSIRRLPEEEKKEMLDADEAVSMLLSTAGMKLDTTPPEAQAVVKYCVRTRAT